MIERRPKHIPVVPNPGALEEHGITIPVPTPTAIQIPNPWKPSAANGVPMSSDAPPSAQAPRDSGDNGS